MHRNACLNCGKALDWTEAENMQSVYILARDAEEAGYWASQYEIMHGSSYAVDTESWRLIHKEYPLVLYFPFPMGKGYGRFMRKAAKEAFIIKSFEKDFGCEQKI